MEQILEFIQTHGLPVFVIASCIIALIGVLKLCKVFDKVTNKNVKKFIYYVLDVALSFGGSAIYFVAFHKAFSGYLVFSVTQVGATTTLYAIYENFGLRKLVQIALNWVVSLFKNDKVKALAKKLGLSEESVSGLINATASAKEVKQAQNEAIAIIKEADKEIKADTKATEQKKAQEAKVQKEKEKATAEQTQAQHKAKVTSTKVKILAERQKQEQQQK